MNDAARMVTNGKHWDSGCTPVTVLRDTSALPPVAGAALSSYSYHIFLMLFVFFPKSFSVGDNSELLNIWQALSKCSLYFKLFSP